MEVRSLLFSDMMDSHDKRTERTIAEMDEPGYFDDHNPNEPLIVGYQTNFNLVGLRRRLNNIEMGVWILVVLAAIHLARHW